MIKNILHELYKQKIQSLIIEGGAKTLQSFIDEKIWEEARVFTANTTLVEGVKSPNIKGEIIFESIIDEDQLEIIKNE